MKVPLTKFSHELSHTSMPLDLKVKLNLFSRFRL